MNAVALERAVGREWGSQYASRQRTPWLYVPRPVERPRLRLICFPYAGGRATMYRAWQDAVPADIEICAVQLPGRGARIDEPPFRRLAPLLDAMLPAIAPLLTCPFVLFGHSLGALIAYELARTSWETGRPLPLHLFVSGCPAPRLVPRVHRPLHALPDEKFIAELERLNGTPQEVLHNAVVMRMALPAIRADLEVFETWQRPETQPLPIPIAAFAGCDDRQAPLHAVAGWHDETRAGFTVHELPGDHFFVHGMQDKLVRIVANIIDGSGPGRDTAHRNSHTAPTLARAVFQSR